MIETFARYLELWREPQDALRHAIDILVVAYLNYRLLKMVRGTRAWRILGGVVIFIFALFLTDLLGLNAAHWILDKASLLAPAALVLLLLPELRQTLESLSKLGLWPERLPGQPTSTLASDTLEEIVSAVSEMAERSIGALIVLERTTKLDEFASNGTAMDAKVSAPTLVSIFYHGNPLHDGAAILRGERIIAAGCRLPSSENPDLDPHVHMRHRAGVGVSEQVDCVVVIVSEERGSMSLAIDGNLRPVRSKTELRDALNKEMRGATPDDPDATPTKRKRGRKRNRVQVPGGRDEA